eukprot:53768-Rhodomonas_salina.1
MHLLCAVRYHIALSCYAFAMRCPVPSRPMMPSLCYALSSTIPPYDAKPLLCAVRYHPTL